MKKIIALLFTSIILGGCQTNTASNGNNIKSTTNTSTNTNTTAAGTPLNHSAHGANHSATQTSASPQVKTA
jgi:PBP1b-binding outer membrane lipoprotein LpoB